MAAISNKEGLKGALIISAVGFGCSLATYLISLYFNAPFHWWYKDTLPLLFVVLINTISITYVWDVALLLTGIIRSFSKSKEDARELWRRYSVFKLGAWPHIWMLFTAYWTLQTSNVMLISIYLIKQGIMQWKDSWFWERETTLMEAIKLWDPNPWVWDVVYNTCWGLSMLAAVFLIGLTRRMSTLLPLLCCYIFVFYVGRLFGLLNPVMGPALYKPGYFTHIDGTFSAVAINLVLRVMDQDPAVSDQSGLLLGGVSAMPSLHVGMVLAIMYWLAIHDRRTLFYTLPWNIVAVSSTVILGWHYAHDAVGGLVLAAFCLAATHLVFRYPFPWQESSYLNTVGKKAKNNAKKKKHTR